MPNSVTHSPEIRQADGDWSDRSGWALPALWLLLLAFQLFKIFHSPVGFDESVFAQAAKNLGLGNGYSIASFDRLHPFSPGITSGPVVILPAALLIKLLGNAYWVPGLASVLLIDALLWAAYRQCARLLPQPGNWRIAAYIFLGLSLLVTNHDTGSLPEKMSLWHGLMGEVPSALLVLTAVMRTAENRYRSRCVFQAGLLAGLAALCKLQALIGGITLGAGLLVHYICLRGKPSGFRPARLLLAYATGLILPLASFECVKMAGLGWSAYLANISALGHAAHEMDRITTPGDILVKLFQIGEYLGICHVDDTSSPLFRPELFIVVMAAFLSSVAAVFYLYRQERRAIAVPPARWACNVLLACCLAHFSWWIFICSARLPRYALQGLLYGLGALALRIGEFAQQNSQRGARYALGALLLAACLRYDAVAYYWTGMRTNPEMTEQQEVLSNLNAVKAAHPDAVFFSCGDTFAMEYLLPASANFVLCERFEERTFAGRPKFLLSYAREADRKMIYWSGKSFIPELRDNIPLATAHCPRSDRYEGEHYSLASCDAR